MDEVRVVDWSESLDLEAERIVAAVFDEYQISFYPHDYDSDLRRIAEVYLAAGGMFRFLLAGDRPVATVAVKPLGPGRCELKRFYLLREERGKGFGGLLLDNAIDWARGHGFREMVAWSDTRFGDAHGAYVSRGFERFALRPEPGPDPAEEYGFRLKL